MHKDDFEGAEALFRRAFQACEKVLGLEHPDTLRVVNNLGSLLMNKGDCEGAEVFLRRALQGYEKALGADHPDTLRSVNAVGVMLSEKGDHESAEALFRRALQGYEKALGVDHPDTLRSMLFLGVLHIVTNRRFEGLELFRDWMALSEKAEDEFRYILASCECLDGNLEEAKRLIEKHLSLHPEIKEQALGDSDFEAIRDFIEKI
jgi:tetratricopeptide (TPR) repeat protein